MNYQTTLAACISLLRLQAAFAFTAPLPFCFLLTAPAFSTGKFSLTQPVFLP
ncbi:MAG: hypothetical protein JSR12_01345 [Bacteroidetes bacterium]|nr:hypothetical protein [Bacteroidota bacterium]